MGRAAKAGMYGVDRGQIDDAASLALGDHLIGGGFAAQPQTLEVGIEHRVPIGLVQLDLRRLGENTGVVDQRVHPAQVFHNGLDHRLHLIGAAQVGLHGHGPASSGFNLGGDVLCTLLTVVIDYGHAGSCRTQCPGDGSPDAPSAAGDDGHLSGEIEPFAYF